MVGTALLLVWPTTTARPAAQQRAGSGLVRLDLWASGRGRIAATIEDAARGESADVVCETGETSCGGDYVPGRIVRLQAKPDPTDGPSAFVGWSDDRCPAAPVCDLPMEIEEQSVTATFSPQPVAVVMHPMGGRAKVTSVPQGLICEAGDLADELSCSAEFPILTDVSLVAEGADPVWGAGPSGDECDVVTGATCHVTAGFGRDVAVAFNGGVRGAVPVSRGRERIRVGVVFHVVRAGTGAGTVRSKRIDCGRDCTVSTGFGERDALVAEAASGSRFVRWRGACGSDPKCSLFVGPVTRLTAVFDAVGKRGSNRGSAGAGDFRAAVGRVAVSGVRGRRAIRFGVGVSSAATVQAALRRKGRAVASRLWQVGRGIHSLRLRVPPGARAGRYQLRITARGRAGTPRRVTRVLRLRR